MIPRAHIAALYRVNITTMNGRIAGTQIISTVAPLLIRMNKLFTPGEERAIAEHCGSRFPVSLSSPTSKNSSGHALLSQTVGPRG